MGSLSRISSALSRWIDQVAESVLAGIEHIRASPRARLAERKDGTLIAETMAPAVGSSDSATPFRLAPGALVGEDLDRAKALVQDAQVEVVLDQDRFVFRPLELPARAGEFLEGIVRSQIDRLTPWSAKDALYGWSPPVETSSGRMVISVAATGRNLVTPLTDTLAGLGAASIRLSVRSPDAGAEPIMVSDQKTRAAREIHHAHRMLVSILAGLGGLAAAAVLAEGLVGSALEARQADNAGRLAAIRATRQAQRDPASEPAAALQRRKQEAPASVLVLEALSAALPDHTYLTELRIQDGKVQIIGMTKDAPALIEQLERSPQFSEASFTAPTTRSLVKPGDNFHIEVKIKPPGPPQP
jgi:general secretion pathway protein L